MPRPINEQVVVITGASSGIGRLTALTFAERGASVVLAARNDTALEDLAREIESKGSYAKVVPTDVSEWEQVQNLAHTAVEQFGRIDTWVNDASVAEYARLEDMTVEEIDQIIHINLIGVIYGSKAAVAVMKPQGGGTIINIASVLAEVSVPLLSIYAAAKHGVKGFDNALRLEMLREKTNVNITTIYPASINTPFFEHSRSKLGSMPRPIIPVYQPEVVVNAIISAAIQPKRDIFAGDAGIFFSWMHKLSPRLTDFYMLQNDRMWKQQRSDRPDDMQDNVFQPSTGTGRAHGDWNPAMPAAPLTQVFEQHPNVKRASLALIAGLFLGMLQRRMR